LRARSTPGASPRYPVPQELTLSRYIALGWAHIQLTWTADLVIRIGQHFVPLRNPAYGTSQGEDSGKQGGWNANSTLNDTRVEVHVGVQFALDKVRIFQSDALQFHGQFEQRIVLQAQGFQNFLAG